MRLSINTLAVIGFTLLIPLLLNTSHDNVVIDPAPISRPSNGIISPSTPSQTIFGFSSTTTSQNNLPSDTNFSNTNTKPATTPMIYRAENMKPSAKQINSNQQLMAWIYPYAPACGAGREYSDGRKIDILKPEFFTINSGSLVLLDESKVTCNGYSPAFVAELKQHSTRQFVTVSSASAETMSSFLEQALKSNTNIETLVSFAVSNNLSGIELNFEDFGGWTAENYVDFKTFVARLGYALQAKDKQLMVIGPPIANAIEEAWFLWRYEDFIGLPINHMVVMGYDYQYDHGASEPIAPLNWLSDVINWVSGRYPQNKLTIALPSYGYEAIVGTHRFSILTQEQLKLKPGYNTATRDPSSAEMTWQYGDKVYFYQDSISLAKKREVINNLGINSISVWHLGGNPWFE